MSSAKLCIVARGLVASAGFRGFAVLSNANVVSVLEAACASAFEPTRQALNIVAAINATRFVIYSFSR